MEPIVASAELNAAYDAWLGACLVVPYRPPGILRLRGGDALAFLHRMSTNDVAGLPPGEVRGMVLTTAIGRTVDVVQVLALPSEALLVTTPGRSDVVREWLGRYIFFNDDVQVEPVAAPLAHFGIFGPEAAAEVARISGAEPPSAGRFIAVADGWLWSTSSPDAGFEILGGEGIQDRISGTPLVLPGAAAAFEAVRIERGVPVVGREIDEDTIPLEVGLWQLVSFSKGCYIGQEVIARMESRSRIARTLVGVRLDGPETVPQDLVVDGHSAGRLTSSAVSPRFGPIGLAVVRTTILAGPEPELLLPSSGARARIVSLPFATQQA